MEIIKLVIKLLTIIPKITGTVTTKNIFNAILSINISFAVSIPKNSAELKTINGTMKILNKLTIAVKLTDKATSPSANLVRIFDVMTVNLSDLFLLFIYAEVLGMVGVFYRDNRIPVTLPIIIAITAVTRMIILQSKGLDAINIIYEASGILLLSVAAYIMSLKDKNSLSKLKIREGKNNEEA